MSVASCDQPAGISAPSILKTTDPSGFVMTLERRSHTTSSRGSARPVVKRRSKAMPRERAEPRPAPRRSPAEGAAPLVRDAAALPPFRAGRLTWASVLLEGPWTLRDSGAGWLPPFLTVDPSLPPSPTTVGCAIDDLLVRPLHEELHETRGPA